MHLDAFDVTTVIVGSVLSIIGITMAFASWFLFEDERVYSRKLTLFLNGSQIGITISVLLSFANMSSAICQIQVLSTYSYYICNTIRT